MKAGDLYVENFPADLRRDGKIAALRAGETWREFVIRAVRRAVAAPPPLEAIEAEMCRYGGEGRDDEMYRRGLAFAITALGGDIPDWRAGRRRAARGAAEAGGAARQRGPGRAAASRRGGAR